MEMLYHYRYTNTMTNEDDRLRQCTTKTTIDRLLTTHTDVPLSLTRHLARRLNKRLDSVSCQYTLLDVRDEFSFVYGNN